MNSEISLNGTVYDFSVDHSSIKKEDIVNIHQYHYVTQYLFLASKRYILTAYV